jgi:hypothetical protein
MTEQQYIIELQNALQVQRKSVIDNLNFVLTRIPEITKKICIDIFLPQDIDGSFTVRISLEGPDLYVLNKQIDDIANIFDIKSTAEGFVPYIPLIEDVEFDAYKIICSCIIHWLKSIWTEIKHQHILIPVDLVIADDYGEFPVVKLK